MATEMRGPDLAEMRADRRARKRRAARRSVLAIRVFTTAMVVGFFFTYVLPAWHERQDNLRFETAHAAVSALAHADRAAFEELLVDDARADAYAASLEVVSIADMSTMSRGHVSEDAAGVVTTEGYEIVVPLTEERRVVPDLRVRPYRNPGGFRVVPQADPIRRVAMSAIHAAFDDDRDAFDALLHEDAPADAWEVSRAAIVGVEPPTQRLRSSGGSGFLGEEFDRYWRSYSPRRGVSLRASLKREGRTWFVEKPLERTR